MIFLNQINGEIFRDQNIKFLLIDNIKFVKSFKIRSKKYFLILYSKFKNLQVIKYGNNYHL